MFIVYILLWMLLILVGGGWLVGRQRRQAARGMQLLADALGFRLLEGLEAVDRTIPPAGRQAAIEAREKVPAALRGMVARAARGALCAAGTQDGVEVSVYLTTRGSKSNTYYTSVRADYPTPLPFELRIGSEGTLTRLGKALFDLADVEIGDPEFDRAIRVKAADAAAARSALGGPGARDALLGLRALSASAYATNEMALWEEQGRHLDLARTRERLAAVVAVARALGRG
jgi:hypothetical protein